MSKEIFQSTMFSLLFLIVVTVGSSSCEKDQKIITNTITKLDTIFITQVDTFVIKDTTVITQYIEDTLTTIFLVRHAETTGSGSNPTLSMLGIERAQKLAEVLSPVLLNVIFTTNFNRTKETAQAVATEQNLALSIYNPSNLNDFSDFLLNEHNHQNILVVGHSNTTPSLINAITGENLFNDFPETQYDNLIILSVFEKGKAKVVHLKYGN